MRVDEETGTVTELNPVDVDGVALRELAVRYDDLRVERAQLAPDRIPAGLAVGDRVRVSKGALYKRWTITIVKP